MIRWAQKLKATKSTGDCAFPTGVLVHNYTLTVVDAIVVAAHVLREATEKRLTGKNKITQRSIYVLSNLDSAPKTHKAKELAQIKTSLHNENIELNFM